jgi:TP901 family phage tail tape measure protein
MADEQIVTNIVATSDFSNLIVDLNKVSSALTKLQDKLQATNKTLAAQVAVMNRSFADTIRSTGQFSTHFVSLTSDVDKFGQQLDKGQMKLGQFFRTYASHAKTNGGLVRDLAKQQVQLQNSILQPLGRNAEGLMQYNVHIPRGLDVVKNKTAIARQELMIMNKMVQEGANSLINWGKNTQWAGRQLTVGLTVPIAAFGKASADAFRSADEQLVRLTKVYGGISQTSSSELLKVRKDVVETARQISKSMGAGFNETIGLAADIAATGKTGNDLLKSVQETTRLAVLGEVDRQEAMKATLAIQSAFKQNTEELTETINFLNAVENQTSTTLNDLVEAIPKAGPIIQGLGGTVQDLALYLTAMREGGVNASEGANALKSALASLINPTNVAKDKFLSFGISLENIVNSNAGNTTATILELQSALDALNPLQKQQALEQLFGKFQFARMNALFENLGRQGSQTLQVLDLMKASSQDLSNLAGRELSAVTESASGKYRRALEGLKADLAAVGDQFLTINTHLINFVDGILKFVNRLPDPIKKVLGVLGMFTAAAGPLIMLTGVLGNFFGYIIKGVSHMRALFKGGEGFKLLTPEILAAQRAGDLVEKTFYSDAKAAAVLKQSIAALSAEFTLLQQRANSAAISVNPAISTAAGNVIIGGQRVVDPNNPLVGKMGTRAAGHHNPVSIMDSNARVNQTIHSFTPQPIPVNRKIGAVPQIFADGDLPKIEGLTTSRGVSTGIVAGEAAKHHALMGTLSMLSKRETTELRKQIKTTGSFSTDINTTFAALVPEMTKLTTNAARQSAAIVQQLQAGKISMEVARAKIIAINAQLEVMMGQATTQLATSLGRTANLTQVPLINQPIVSPKGKANMKEIFRSGRPGSGIIDRIARVLGVKTYGAGYSTETTTPKMMATGGTVYRQDGSTEPEFKPMGTDTVPAMLTPGEFVVTADAVTKDTLPILKAINSGDLEIDTSKKPVAAHASLPMRMAAHEVASNYGPYMPAGMSDFSTAFPDQEMSIKDGQRLGLFREENDSLRMGKRGLSRRELIRALDVPEDQLFKFMPELDKEVKQKLKFNLLKSATALPAGQMFHDDTLAAIFNDAKKSTYMTLTGPSKEKFKSDIQRRQKPAFLSQTKLSNLMSGDEISMTSAEARAAAAGGTKTFVSPQRKDAVIVAGRTHESGQTRSFKKGILDDPKVQGPLNHRKIPVPLSQKLMRLAHMRSGRSFASGGMVYMANGGMVSMPQALPVPAQNGKYNMGGMVQGYNRGGMVAQMLLPMLGYMGGQSIGTQVGGAGGGFTGGMIGSMIPSMLMGGMGSSRTKTAPGSDEAYEKYGNTVGKSALANNKFSLSLANSAAQGSKVSRVLTTLIGGLTKTNLIVAGVTTVLAGGYAAFRNYQEGVKLNVSTFGLTAEAAEKAGLKVTDYSSAIKNSTDTISATIERNKMLYDSMNSAGIPIKMTIEEYRKLKEEVKNSMSESIQAINRMKETDLKDYAERLKAQMIAAGSSAEDASKKIYAAFALSNKAELAGASTVGNIGFNKIQDGITAAIEAYQVFNDTVKNESADSQGMALTTSLEAANKAVEEAIALSQKKADADKEGKTAVISRSQAELQVLDQIKSKVSLQEPVSQGLLDNIFAQNREAKKFLSLQDTSLSIYQKLRLQAQGYTGDLSMGALAADRLFSMRAAIESSVTSFSTSQGGPLFGISQKLITAEKQYKKLQAASKGASAQQQIDSRKAGEAIDERIKKIKEEADARRKALTQTLQDEDFLTQIKKKQLEYQDALASGDMSRAAQAQLDIQSLNRQQQTNKAMDAIDEKEKSDLKPLEAQRKALSDANQKLSDSASLAGNGLQKLAADIEKYKTQMSGFTSALTNFLTFISNPANKGKSAEGPAAALVDATKAIGFNMPDKFSGPRPKGTTEIAQEIASRFPELLKTINADSAVINVNSATIDEKRGVTERFYGRGPSGGPSNYTGRMGTSGLPSISNPVDYGKKSIAPNYQYQSGSSYVYTPPVADIKVPSIPKMSSSGPVISTVPKSNFGGIFDRSSSSSSSSSSVNIGTLSVNYPKAPDNAKEFFAQVEEIARQKGIKVTSGGKKAQ